MSSINYDMPKPLIKNGWTQVGHVSSILVGENINDNLSKFKKDTVQKSHLHNTCYLFTKRALHAHSSLQTKNDDHLREGRFISSSLNLGIIVIKYFGNVSFAPLSHCGTTLSAIPLLRATIAKVEFREHIHA